MGPLGSGPRYGTDRLGQYKTYGIVQSIRAQRGRARSALYKRVVFSSYDINFPGTEILILKIKFFKIGRHCNLKSIRLLQLFQHSQTYCTNMASRDAIVTQFRFISKQNTLQLNQINVMALWMRKGTFVLCEGIHKCGYECSYSLRRLLKSRSSIQYSRAFFITPRNPPIHEECQNRAQAAGFIRIIRV